MAKVSEITEPYFSHDIATRQDEKILKMLFAFRKRAKDMTREELESFAALGSYGLFWSIVEYMHRNTLMISDSDVIADDLRISEKFVKMILDEFELFRVENEQYISDRILKNINKQEEKSSANSKAAKARWVLAKLKNDYIAIYGSAPVLTDKEIAIFLKYSEQVENFKDNLADYLYTLKELKFENNPKFNPSINWLLTENHFAKLINGEYGKLKSWAKVVAERKEKEKAQKAAAEKEEQEQIQKQAEIDSILTREDAIEALLKKGTIWMGFRNCVQVREAYSNLLENFNISYDEINELKKAEQERSINE